MNYRAASEIIDRIADRIALLAEYARALDQSLFTGEPMKAPMPNLSEIQHVDALAQYLSDMEALLRAMSPMLPEQLVLPTEKLRSAVHLDAMQRLITGTEPFPSSESNAGDVTLF